MLSERLKNSQFLLLAGLMFLGSSKELTAQDRKQSASLAQEWKMKIVNGKITAATAFLDTCELSFVLNNQKAMSKSVEETKEYIGMWVTKDGYVRHHLLPNNRYDEARGDKESAYQGSYWVKGNHIDYKDDTGFTADGEFKDGILYHGGMILYKENN